MALFRKEYERAVKTFISDIEAVEANENITEKFQKYLRMTLNEFKQLVDENNKWRYINLNPDCPRIPTGRTVNFTKTCH